MNDQEAFEMIVKKARSTNKKIKDLTDKKGTFGNPVDIDAVKTMKAMFFEEVVEILRKKRGR